MSKYFNTEIYAYDPKIWEFPNDPCDGLSSSKRDALNNAFHRVTGLPKNSVHWCSGLWVLLGDTSSGKTTLQSLMLKELDTKVWKFGEPGYPIFPYDQNSWNFWCTGLMFCTDRLPKESEEVTHNTVYKLGTPVSDVEEGLYIANLQLRYQIQACDFNGAAQTIRDFLLHPQAALISSKLKALKSALTKIERYQRDRKQEPESLQKDLASLDFNFERDTDAIDLNIITRNWVPEIKSGVIGIDSLTQLPYKQSQLSYTTGGLAIDVFKSFSQLDYIARLKKSVLLATFNPTVFSKQIMGDFYQAVPGVVTGMIGIRSTDNFASTKRTLEVLSREYIDDRAGKREVRHNDTFTYSLEPARIAQSESDDQEGEEDFAPATFY